MKNKSSGPRRKQVAMSGGKNKVLTAFETWLSEPSIFSDVPAA